MAEQLKHHKSIEEQIQLLKSRGLIIEDEEAAVEVLERINYYRLSGYLFGYKKNGSEQYVEGTSFNELIRIYEFDAKFTNILMYVLEDIEETFKTRFSYTLSSAFPENPEVYLDTGIYKDIEAFSKFETLFAKAKKTNEGLPFIQHHYKVYGGKLPIWAAVEIMTMGNLHSLYDNLKPCYKKIIAKKYNTGADQLDNWLRNITYTRNHLAHFMRIHKYIHPLSVRNTN